MKLLLLSLLTLPFFCFSQTTTTIVDFENGPFGTAEICGSGSLCHFGQTGRTITGIHVKSSHGCPGLSCQGCSGSAAKLTAWYSDEDGSPFGSGIVVDYNFKPGYSYKITLDASVTDNILQMQMTNNPTYATNLCTFRNSPVDISGTTNPFASFNSISGSSSATLTPNECYSYLWFSSLPQSGSENAICWIRKITIEETYNISITGSPICSGFTSSQFTLNGIPLGTTVSWQSSNTNIVTVPSTGNPVTVTKVGPNGTAILTATVSICGLPVVLTKKAIVGVPSVITNLDEVKENNDCVTETSTYTVIGGEGATNYKWYVRKLPSSSYTLMADGPNNIFEYTTSIKKTSCTDYFVKVEATNVCNSSSPVVFTYQSQTCPCNFLMSNSDSVYTLTIAPNPVNTFATVSLTPTAKNSMAKNPTAFISRVEIIDKFNNVKKTFRFENKQLSQTIDFSNLVPDLYLLRVYNGHSWKSIKAIVR